MKLKDNLVTNENKDDTVTIYDLDNGSYYELNEMATYIFRNIVLSDNDLIDKIYQQFETDDRDIASEVGEMKKYISEEYFG